MLHPEGEMGNTLLETERHHQELSMESDFDTGGESDE